MKMLIMFGKMVFNSTCRYGTQVKIKIDETRKVVYHLPWFTLQITEKPPTVAKTIKKKVYYLLNLQSRVSSGFF